MIVPGQQNIKVHFAGIENREFTALSISVGVKYGLYSAYKFVMSILKKSKNQKSYEVIRLMEDNYRHVIQDSGLFTLLFGAMKGKTDQALLENWLDALIDHTIQSGFSGTVVEADVQNIAGNDLAWKFRNRLRQSIPNKIINVIHQADGSKGLERMIEFSDYIALSIPESRFNGKKDHIVRLANYIKTKKPSIDIHLLGCTEDFLLKQLSFCSSSDSTSWLSPQRYGSFGNKKHASYVNREKVLEKIKDKKMFFSIADKKTKIYPYVNALSAMEYLDRYTKLTGPQD